MVDLDKLAVDFWWAHRRNDREAMADIARQAMGAGERVTFPDGSICDARGHGEISTGWPVHFAAPEWVELLGSRVATRCARECMTAWAELCARFAVAAVAVGDPQKAASLFGLLSPADRPGIWVGLRNGSSCYMSAHDAVYMMNNVRRESSPYLRAEDIGRVMRGAAFAVASTASTTDVRPQLTGVAWQLMAPLVCALISPPKLIAWDTLSSGGNEWTIKYSGGELTPYRATPNKRSTNTTAPA